LSQLELAEYLREANRQMKRRSRQIGRALTTMEYLTDQHETAVATELFKELEASEAAFSARKDFPIANPQLFALAIAALMYAEMAILRYGNAWEAGLVLAKHGPTPRSQVVN
jgi:hypothetical protein